MGIDVKNVEGIAGNLRRFVTHAIWISIIGITVATIVNTPYAPAENLDRMEPTFDPRCEVLDNSAVLALNGLLVDRSNDAMVRARRSFYLLHRARSSCRFYEVAFARHNYFSIMNIIAGNDR
jgi:hypothetical protein